MAAVATRRGILGSNRYQGTEFNAETCEFSNKDPFLSFFVRSRNAKKSFLYLERFSRILQVISFINFNRITLIFRYKVAQRRCRFRCSKLWIPDWRAKSIRTGAGEWFIIPGDVRRTWIKVSRAELALRPVHTTNHYHNRILLLPFTTSLLHLRLTSYTDFHLFLRLRYTAIRRMNKVLLFHSCNFYWIRSNAFYTQEFWKTVIIISYWKCVT